MDSEVSTTERVLGGRYRIEHTLGQGGMADVYAAHDERLDRPVAVKVLRPGLASDAGVRDRFETEARSAARLSHPNVVAVFDTGEHGGVPYLVMERLPGQTLADRIQAGNLDMAWVLRAAGDVLRALGAAHAAGIVHRDVKPGNILIGADGCAKVADFGIAKSVEASTQGDPTMTGVLLGTPAYLAPERIDGAPATAQSDLYAVGVVLYEALTGTRAFAGPTPVAVARSVQHDTPAPLRQLNPDVPPALASVIEQAMDKDPARRPASAAAMAAALGVDGKAGTAVLTSPAGTDTIVLERMDVHEAGAGSSRRRGGRRLSVVPVLVAAAIVFLLAFAAAASLRPSGATGTAATTTTVRDDVELAGRLEDLATRVLDDGDAGAQLANRLRVVATDIRLGDDATVADANRLLSDATAWAAAGAISPAHLAETQALLSQIGGVSVTTTTAESTPSTEPTTVPTTTRKHGHDKPRRGD